MFLFFLVGNCGEFFMCVNDDILCGKWDWFNEILWEKLIFNRKNIFDVYDVIVKIVLLILFIYF